MMQWIQCCVGFDYLFFIECLDYSTYLS